ncbi:MAG TPA: hypothetical protein PKZ16_01670 [bacterium]|nr:hypothetical protein [bacterium]
MVNQIYRGNDVGSKETFVRVVSHHEHKNEVQYHFCDQNGRAKTGLVSRTTESFLSLFRLA